MPSLLAAFRNKLLNLAFPQKCHVCTESVEDERFGVACERCWAVTTIFADHESLCPKCGACATNRGVAFECRNCSTHHYDLARSVGLYEKALVSSVLNLKRHPIIPKVILEKIRDPLLAGSLTDCDVIVPVPLSKQRLIERGYNQAEVIAEAVAGTIQKPVDVKSLIRTKDTPTHRAAMDRKAREQTVQNAFGVLRPKLIEDRAVLLVDDIFTSGATASNCAKALKKKGASKVNVFTIARTS